MGAEETRRFRILVVDDNAANAELLEAYLAGFAWDVETVNSGAAALERVGREQPDIILLDIMMPDMSGYEVCRRLKSSAETRDVPIIMVTALTQVEEVEEAVDAGTDDFLSKPVNRLELVTRVKSLLRLRHLKGELARTLAYLDEVEERGAGR